MIGASERASSPGMEEGQIGPHFEGGQTERESLLVSPDMFVGRSGQDR